MYQVHVLDLGKVDKWFSKFCLSLTYSHHVNNID